MLTEIPPLGAINQHGGTVGWAVGGACLLASALCGVRWLRVAQREHYLSDSASRFALRWWSTTALNRTGAVLGLAGVVLASRWAAAALAPAAIVAIGPLGLGLRGRTSSLRWTRRLRTLAVVWALIQAGIAVVGFLAGFAAVVCAAGALAVPAIVDVSCLATEPFERLLADRHVRRARTRLERVHPRVVAITGSYGKTSTKGYVAHLLGGSTSVLASPASFNNRAGLARALNEHLADGTEVFVAEMGTYGPGEIAELCSWMRPDVAVITAIGPVHLERFRSEERIVEAKAEILEGARSCVLAVDDERLARLADRCESAGKKVWRVSGGSGKDGSGKDGSGKEVEEKEVEADVSVVQTGEGLEVRTRVGLIAHALPIDARRGNVACAVAVALELGVTPEQIASRLATLPPVAHRLEPRSGARGFVILDDTYNSNPSGAKVALATLAEATRDTGRRVVVTPGMVELGARQAEENELFAQAAARISAELVVVGRTNRRALLRGYRRFTPGPQRAPLVVRDRDQAVEWVRDNLGPGDAVLYENDLPDHYP